MPTIVLPDSVRNCYLFSGMAEQEKNELLINGHIRSYAKGEYLFRHGDPIRHFYILCSGTVQLMRQTPDGRQFTTGVIVAGRSIGETKIFSLIHEHQLNAIAVEDTAAIQLSMALVKENAKKHSMLALNLLTELSQQAHLASVDAEHQATMTAAQRVACFFQQLCILHNADPAGFELPYSKALIASRLGIEPETFSRVLVKIREFGITVSGTRVSIKDLNVIEQYVCDFCSIADECPEHKALERKMHPKPDYGT